MAVLKIQLDWYGSKGQATAVTLTDYESINVVKGAEPKSNSMEILLKHPISKYIDEGTGELIFGEDDIFKLYMKYDTDNSGLDTSTTSSDLIIIGELQDVDTQMDNKRGNLKLKCVDRTYTLLNRIWSKTYAPDDTAAPNGEGWNAPEIIQNVIRSTTGESSKDPNELFDYDGDKPGIFEIDARLDSDGSGTGYIETTRPSQGTADSDTDLFPGSDNTAFPFIQFAKSVKPVYEWINDLSQVENCNTADEQDPAIAASTLVVQRAMRYYVDEQYRFHWFYPTNTPSLYMTDGTTTAISPDTAAHKITAVKGKYSVFDIVNFVIFRAGTDMDGAQILGYQLDSTSGKLKPTFRPFIKIAEKMKKEDYEKGSLQQSANGDSRYYDYPASYPVTPRWDPELRSVANDSEYNANFREVATRKGKSAASNIIWNSTNPRWKVNLTLKGENLTPADLIQYNSSRYGIINLPIRINNVKHAVTKMGWQTTIELEEDSQEVQS